MDQIFERLERLVKAWANSFTDSSATVRRQAPTAGGDADYEAAMAELDDYLDTSRLESEKRETRERKAQEDRERHAREEQARRYREQMGANGGAAATSKVIEDAYRYLGFPPYAHFADVKAAYKRLLFKYHPDRNTSSPESLKASTEKSARINAAFQIIETYEESKRQGAGRS